MYSKTFQDKVSTNGNVRHIRSCVCSSMEASANNWLCDVPGNDYEKRHNI